MKRTIFISLLMFLFIVGCELDDKSADSIQREQTERLMQEVNRQVGLPNIVNYQQKKLMKMIMELCDKEDLVCYAYLHSEYTGKLLYLGKCYGFGVPFSAQYTNPERLTNPNWHDSPTLPQPDPNGLFMPTSSSATWLIFVNPETQEPSPGYLEPNIIVVPFILPNNLLLNPEYRNKLYTEKATT